MIFTMKNILYILFALIFGAGIAAADIVDEQLPASAPEPLKAQTRAMIQAGVPQEDAVKMTRAMLQNRFELQHMLAAQTIVQEAHQQGLPVKPITDKAYEGIAKQVRSAAVVRAMQNVRSRYEFAYSKAALINQSSKEQQQLGNKLAACLSAGVSKADAERIMASLHGRIQTMDQSRAHALSVETLNTTRDMARLGASSTETANVVCQALQQGYAAGEMNQMRNAFMSRARHGAANDLAKSYSRSLQQGKGNPGSGRGNEGSGGQGPGSGAGGQSGGSGSGGSGGGTGSGGSGSGNGSGGSGGGSGSGGSSGGSGSGGSNGGGGSDGSSGGNGSGNSGGSGGSGSGSQGGSGGPSGGGQGGSGGGGQGGNH